MTALDAAPARVRGLRLRSLLALLVVSIVVPYLVLTACLVWRISVMDRHRADREALDLARTVSIRLDRELDAFTQFLTWLANSPYLREGQYRAFDRQAREATAGRDVSVVLKTADGMVLVDTANPWNEPSHSTRLDPGNSDPSQLKLGAIEISGLVQGTTPQSWMIVLTAPLLKSGQISHQLALTLDVGHFQRLLAITPVDPEWVLAMSDGLGRLIARSRTMADYVGRVVHTDVRAWSPGQSGVHRTVSLAGADVLRGYQWSKKYGWIAAAFIPTEVIDAPLRELWRIIAILSSGVAALVVPLALFISRQITDPISSAAAAASLLGRGKAITPVASRLLEANALLQALSRSSVELAERGRALAANEARFRSVFEQSAVGFAQIDLDGYFIGINDRLCSLLGRSREECMRATFDHFTHPDDRAAEAAMIASLLAGQKSSYEIEKRLVTKSGDLIWVQVTSSLVRADEDDHPSYRTSVVEDITERRRAREAAARLGAIVQASPDAIMSVSREGIIETWNPAAEGLFGYTEGEAVGYPVDIIVSEDRRTDFKVAFAAALAGTAVTLETRCDSREKAAIDVAASLAPILTGAHVGSVSISMNDIRVRKRREAHIMLLNRELAHRVKNTLAVIISITNQTLRSSPHPSEFRAAFQGRLQALSAANDLLMQTSWTGADARDFIDKQLSPLIPDGYRHLQKEGPPVRIPAQISIPLGLALHELGTNAIKHGAWSVPPGQVRITWSLAADPAPPHGRLLRLTWTERGGPRVATPSRRGFGATLIERGIPEARVRRCFEESGFVCEIEIPLDGRDAA